MTKRNKGINLSAPAAPAPQDSKAAATGANDGSEEQNEETGGDEQQNEQHDGDEQDNGQDNGQDKDETVMTDSAKTSSDPTEPAVLVEPERGGPARLRSTQFQMYHPYLRVYFHQDGGPDGKGTLIPFVDSWTKCQIDAGLLEEVPEESKE